MGITILEGPIKAGNPIICLGDFDGVHLGHKKLLESGARQKAGVLLFDKDPASFLQNGKSPYVLTGLKDKVALMGKIGIDDFYIIPVNLEFFALSPEEFINKYLVLLGVKKVICGSDYRFGSKASGGLEELRKHFAVEEIDLLNDGDEKIASRNIKILIANGDIKKANRLLGHDYVLSGVVAKGLHNGHKLGFPTINLALEYEYVVPKFGVYAGIAEIDGKSFRAMVNVGVNPTIGKRDTPSFEAYLLDYEGEDLYGKKVHLSLFDRERDEMKFDSLEKLSAQLEKDFLWRKSLDR
ncbi:MAG: riboflavin biosynthesis protein RibF [Bacillota bacterium]|nr:riboflavin biosynthesis protein RibF [Bacillota bacterium]